MLLPAMRNGKSLLPRNARRSTIGAEISFHAGLSPSKPRQTSLSPILFLFLQTTPKGDNFTFYITNSVHIHALHLKNSKDTVFGFCVYYYVLLNFKSKNYKISEWERSTSLVGPIHATLQEIFFWINV